MSPLETSALIFACIFGSAMLGMWLHRALPRHHLNNETTFPALSQVSG
jgi:hypothetical protein